MTRAREIPVDLVKRMRQQKLTYPQIASQLGLVDGAHFQAQSLSAAVARYNRTQRRQTKP